MKRETQRAPVLAGLLLCALALALSAVTQQVGYLAWLDSDVAAELLLAKRQADTGSLVQMDWLYSTEIRILSPNLLYALAFALGAGYRAARVIGNTMGLALMMGACAFLLRRAKLPWGTALSASALTGITLGPVYGYAMTAGGFYLFHGIFCFLSLGLWIQAAEGESGTRGGLALAAHMGLSAVLGFLSVRYVLCFLCPMMAVAVMDMLLAPRVGGSLRDRHMRLGGATAAGFLCGLAGYGAGEVLIPRLFHSGVGAASTFCFGALDAGAMAGTLRAIMEDFLLLLGWRGGVALFSAAGLVNLCIAGVLFLGAVMTVRAYRALSWQDEAQRRQRRLMQAALAALLVNLFCFLTIKGTYLNRYLILAVLPLVPVLAVAARQERSQRLRAAFLLLLCVQVGLGSALLLSDIREEAEKAKARGASLMDAADRLMEAGYAHGYGTFWNARLLEERTQGALTFTGVSIEETEEGAASPVTLRMIRWLEADGASHLDACPGKTFLLLTREESERLAPWLEMTGADIVVENEGYRAYGFDSSQAIGTWMLLGSMKLENARSLGGGAFELGEGGRMRVPTTFREAGRYTLRFACEGDPAADSLVRAYTGRDFALLGEQPLAAGDNAFSVTLAADDKYFMLLFTGGQAQRLTLSGLRLEKE